MKPAKQLVLGLFLGACSLFGGVMGDDYLALGLLKPRISLLDANGDLLLTTGDYTVKKLFVSDNSIIDLVGHAAGPRAAGDTVGVTLSRPTDIGIEPNGNLLILEAAASRIRRWNMTSNTVSTIYSRVGALPSAVVIDRTGNIIWVEWSSYTVFRWNVGASAQTRIAGTLGVSGFVDGIGTNARFSVCFDIILIDANTYIVSDSGNSALRRVTPSGNVTTIVRGRGFWGIDYHAATDTLFAVTGATNNVFAIKYSALPSSRAINATSMTILVTEGTADAVAVSNSSTVYFTSSQSGTVFSMLVCPSNTYKSGTVCVNCPDGSCSQLGSLNSTACLPCTLRLGPLDPRTLVNNAAVSAYQIEFDKNGDLLVANLAESKLQLVFVGNGSVVTLQDSVNVTGVTESPAGDVIYLDSTTGIISRLNPAYPSVVTPVASVRPNTLTRITCDPNGNVLWVDRDTHVLRRWNNGAFNDVTNVAGLTGEAGYVDSPVGTLVRFNSPLDVVAVSADTYVVADFGNGMLRVVSSSGATSTLVKNVSVVSLTFQASSRTIYGIADADRLVYAIKAPEVAPTAWESAEITANVLPGDLTSLSAVAVDPVGNLVFADSTGSIKAATTCAAGSYWSTTGSGFCAVCPANTYSSAGSENCTACPAGQCAPSGSASCSACATSSTSSTAASTTTARGTPTIIIAASSALVSKALPGFAFMALSLFLSVLV